MPAGRGKECENCSWERSFGQRSAILVESFEHALTRQRFADFCRWLKSEMGPHKATLKLESYLIFFSFLETHQAGVPSYVSLLNHFDADGLRRLQTPMLWLKVRYGVEPDAFMREEHSDKRRIDGMVEAVPAGVAAEALVGYRAFLQTKQAEGRTTTRSVRISLRAAVNLLASTSSTFDILPTQKSVTAYLTHTPGQAAAVQGFIGYLNRTHGSSLLAEVDVLAKARARTKKLESELFELYQRAGEGEAFERAWIKTTLMLLHGVVSVNKKTVVYRHQSFQGQSGFRVTLKRQDYWVPSPEHKPTPAKIEAE
ncbi:hypothetical protein ACI2KL_08365 [Pseudomonas yamanorum]|uniref:hypothetical protein n=1 Tax=Pseudomonas yamanorum TaxID=515393 RepID=UPI0038505FC1